MARDDFNTQFAAALENKMKTREARGRAFDASAGFDTARAGVVGANSRSAIDLRGAQAGFERERTGLLGRQVESEAGLRDQQARTSRIGTNIGLGTFMRGADPTGFSGAVRDFEGAGLGTPVFNTPKPGSVASQSGGGFDTSGGFNREDYESKATDADRALTKSSLGILDKQKGRSQSQRLGLTFANGGVVGAPDSALVNEYQLYREAAIGAGIPALPMKEAIPRMAQLRQQKRQGVMDMIAKGGTTPQGYADGGEIDGPGTGKSDSIPAMIDGVQAAAVSDGEFLIPRHVVDYFGTKMFDGLVEKARMAGNATKRKTEYGCGGAVKRHGR